MYFLLKKKTNQPSNIGIEDICKQEGYQQEVSFDFFQLNSGSQIITAYNEEGRNTYSVPAGLFVPA